MLAGTLTDIDWSDAFGVELPEGVSHDPDFWRRRLFAQATTGTHRVDPLRIRDALATRAGLQAVAPGGGIVLPVHDSSATEVVVGLDDKHLDLRVSITLRRRPGGDVLVLTTAVRRHNLLGRAYFFVIRPAHRFVAPLWTRRTVLEVWRSG